MILSFFSVRTLLLALCLSAVGHAKQQCRLVAKLDVQGGAAIPTQTAPTGTATASATPSLAPFNYGKDTIRGVNL